MPYKFNPLIYTGLDLSGSGGTPPPSGSPSWKDPVANVTALPSTGNADGDARVTLDTQHIYIWSSSDSQWHDINPPVISFDIPQTFYNGTEQTSFTDITGFETNPVVSSFEALIHIVTNSGAEVVNMACTRTTSGVSKIEQRSGDATDVEFRVVDTGSLKVQYKTGAAPEGVSLSFRAITLV